MSRTTLGLLRLSLRQRGWVEYDRPFMLNIAGIRSPSTRPNSFDDAIAAWWRGGDGKWQMKMWPATTDPGTYWLRQPMQPQGTAILREGQYVGAYGLALHRGQYTALCQVHRPVTVIRDYDRDAVLDFTGGTTSTGMFGINVHRATANGSSLTVDKWSAGCQVFQRSADFDEFIALCRKHQQLYGNRFTYTLLDLRAIRRAKRRRQAAWAAATGLALALGIGYAITKQ